MSDHTADAAVPRDTLLPQPRRFDPPHPGSVTALFQRSIECVTAGGAGVRSTAHIVLGCLDAHRAGHEHPATGPRIGDGLGQLLDVQGSEGGFDESSTADRRQRIGASAVAGSALLDGYKLLGDPHCLQAAEQAAASMIDATPCCDESANSSAIWLWCSLYRITGDAGLLRAAFTVAQEGVLAGQLPHGGWPAPNDCPEAHASILRGLAHLSACLPREHFAWSRIEAALIAALNRVIAAQTDAGDAARPAMLCALIDADRQTPFDLANVIHGLFGSIDAVDAPPADVLYACGAYLLWRAERA